MASANRITPLIFYGSHCYFTNERKNIGRKTTTTKPLKTFVHNLIMFVYLYVQSNDDPCLGQYVAWPNENENFVIWSGTLVKD